MKVKNDVLSVDTQPAERVHGALPEPEERPVTRTITTDAVVGDQGMLHDENALLPTMTAQVQQVTTVANAVGYVTNQCFSCKHFNRPRAQRNLQLLKTDKDPARKALYDAFVAKTMENGEQNPEVALSQYGVCDAWTDAGVLFGLTKEEAMCITQPLGRCFSEVVVPPSQRRLKLPKMPYEPRDAFVNADRLSRREALLTQANDANKK